MDEKILARSSNQEDLTDVWSSLVRKLKDSEPMDNATFLKNVEPWIGSEFAAQLLSIAAEVQVDADEALTQLGN